MLEFNFLFDLNQGKRFWGELLFSYTQRSNSQQGMSFLRKQESRKTLDSGSSPE